MAVDFRSRRFAFRGAGGEPPRRRWRLRGLTCPANPAGVYAPSTPINRSYIPKWKYVEKHLRGKSLKTCLCLSLLDI